MKHTKLKNKNKILFLFIFTFTFIGLILGTYRDERSVEWRNDIDYLAEQLTKKHVNLFFKLSENDFKKEIKTLKRKVYKLNDDEIIVELMKIFADIGDEHTTINYFDGQSFPLKFYWFEDGIYVIDTISEYSKVNNCKLTKINGIDINTVLDTLTQLIPSSNNQWSKYNVTKLLAAPNILYGTGIVDSKNKTTYTFTNNTDVEFSMDIKSNKTENIIWLDNETKKFPLYRKNPDKYYWFEYIPEYNTIYYKHNVSRDQSEMRFVDFSIELFSLIEEKKPDKFILDLRDNSGGDSKYIDNIIDKIKLTTPELNEQNNLYIIIGRKTFSSAVNNCVYAKSNSNAIFIGEDTGGNPNGYGEVQLITLPNSKKQISYSTKKFEGLDKEINTFEPDIEVKVKSSDYFENKDPIIDVILQTLS